MKRLGTFRKTESVMMQMHYGGRLSALKVRMWRIIGVNTNRPHYAHQTTTNFYIADTALSKGVSFGGLSQGFKIN